MDECMRWYMRLYATSTAKWLIYVSAVRGAVARDGRFASPCMCGTYECVCVCIRVSVNVCRVPTVPPPK